MITETYRPQTLDAFVGQPAVLRAIEAGDMLTGGDA